MEIQDLPKDELNRALNDLFTRANHATAPTQQDFNIAVQALRGMETLICLVALVNRFMIKWFLNIIHTILNL